MRQIQRRRPPIPRGGAPTSPKHQERMFNIIDVSCAIETIVEILQTVQHRIGFSLYYRTQLEGIKPCFVRYTQLFTCIYIYINISHSFSLLLLVILIELLWCSFEDNFLVRDHETSNSGRSQSSHDAGDEGREGEFRHISASRGSELGQNTNLNTERADVAKAAAGISGNKLRASSEGGVVFQSSEVMESVVLVLLYLVSGRFACMR